jgi:hypothetical protein
MIPPSQIPLRQTANPTSILKTNSSDYTSSYPNTPNKYTFSAPPTKPYTSTYPSTPTRPHSTSPIPRPTSTTKSYPPSTASPQTSRYTPAHTPTKHHENSSIPTRHHENTSSSNGITVAMAMALSSRERDEYVARIKARNRSAAMTSDSILDRFYSDRIAT